MWRPMSIPGGHPIDSAGRHSRPNGTVGQLPLGRQSPNSVGSLAARLSAADRAGNQVSSRFVAGDNGPSQASPRFQMRKRSQSGLYKTIPQCAYLTEQPYGREVGVLTALPAIASPKACDT